MSVTSRSQTSGIASATETRQADAGSLATTAKPGAAAIVALPVVPSAMPISVAAERRSVLRTGYVRPA